MPVYFGTLFSTVYTYPLNLTRTTLATTAETPLYTVPTTLALASSTGTNTVTVRGIRVTSVYVTTLTSSPVTFGLGLITSGSAAASTNRWIPDQALNGLSLYEFSQESEILNPGDFISAKATATNAVRVSINGEVLV